MQDGDPPLTGAHAHIAVGEIDGIDNIAVFQIVHHLADGHLRAVVLGFLRGGPQVGDGDAAGHFCRPVIGEIRNIAPDLAGGQSCGHGLVIHQQVPGEVQNHHAVLHLGNGLGVDHLLGVLQQRGMQGDKIAVGKNLLPAVYPVNLTVQVPGGVNGDEGVAAVNLHSQLPGGVGKGAAHRAQADHAQGLAQNLVTCKLGFALLHLLRHIRSTGNGFDPLHAAHHIPAAQQQAAEGQLHNAAGVGPGGIEHHNALLRAAVQGNIVHPRTGSGHGQKPVGEGKILHGRAAHQQRIRVLDFFGNLIIFRPKGCALWGYFIEIVYLKHGRSSLFSHSYSLCSKSAMNSVSFFTPSMGMAL